jgi:CRISPR-associated exonuclease Cas4
MLILAFALLFTALVLIWQSNRRRASIGLPAGRVVYADTRAWGPVDQPLYDAELGLVGKPDYLVETADQIIPVEVKSGRISSAPYDSHIFQLAAYCLLTERHFGKRPTYGILHYPNRTFAIDYTPQLERALLNLIDEIHSQGRRKDIPRSHESAARCNRCGYRGICDQRLL